MRPDRDVSHRGGSFPYLPDGSPFRLNGVVFDFDGTLTLPGMLDFAAIHDAVGSPRDVGLLEFLAALEDLEERGRKEAVLHAAEMEAAGRAQENEGASELVSFLRERGIPMAIITRNSRAAVERAMARLPGIALGDFALVVSRDLPLNPKPFPDGVEFAARELGVESAGLLMIGDHAFDIEAGKRAGTLTMFLRNDPRETRSTGDAHFVVDTLWDAGRIIAYGLPLPTGKLPADMLQVSLGEIVVDDSTLLVGAGVGEDAAAIDIGDDEVLVLASDPITLAVDAMACYTVLVNTNDVAAAGATPRWLLSTLLFPPGSSGSEVLALTRDIQRVCSRCGVTLCGGHTEISDAVSRPVVVGTVAGTAKRSRLVDKKSMQEGDHILLTKGVAIEGTGLIAREFGRLLAERGLSSADVDEAAGFLERIGILEEARIATSFSGVSALHDVTEGGLATAVRELGAAGGRRLRLRMERIPVYPLTARICTALDLDPLGLIGSGSLLITCAAAEVDALAAAITGAGIEVSDIGEVLGKGEGIDALRNGEPSTWPVFIRDEVSRLARH